DDVHGRHGLRDRSVTQLALPVPAPTPDRAVVAKRAGVRDTVADVGDARQAGDRDRAEPVDVRAVPELAVLVVPPAPDRAIAEHGARGAFVGGQGDGAGDALDLDGCEAADGRSVAELTPEIAARTT